MRLPSVTRGSRGVQRPSLQENQQAPTLAPQGNLESSCAASVTKLSVNRKPYRRALWRGVLCIALLMSRRAAAYHVSRHESSRSCAGLHRNNGAVQPDRRSFLDLLFVGGAAVVAPCPVNAMSTDPKKGISLPDLAEIENAVPKDWSGAENPFLSSDANTMFGRLDASPDTIFYTDPRFVEHVDENAVEIMTKYISTQAISPGDSVLDLCSSWTSHVDSGMAQQVKRFAGLGMNSKELEGNAALTEWAVQDLNNNPKLPYDDNSFDVVLCQLSIDYLTKPLEVLREAGRVLKSGGKIHILFSNRLFLSKAVGLWTGADDLDHAYYVGCYLHFCDGGYGDIVSKDLSTRKGRAKRIAGDPMYAVIAEKSTP
jgi:SAM-dependent methyltransferase